MNLVTRSLDAALARPCPARPTDYSPAIHSLTTREGRAVLDVASGTGSWVEARGGPVRPLTTVETRLVLLDWTRTWSPLLTPDALWAVEVALLAAQTDGPAWRAWAQRDLGEALRSLLDSPLGLGEEVRRLVAALGQALKQDGGRDLGDPLRVVVGAVETALVQRWGDRVDSSPAPAEVARCSEVEWDLVAPAWIDLGELAVRSRIHGTVWAAVVAPHPARPRTAKPRPPLARLVDDATGELFDEVELELVDGVLSARGYVPPAARGLPTRVDVTADRGRPPRSAARRAQVLREQAVFRTLFFARQAAVAEDRADGWAEWAETYQRRHAVTAEPTGAPFLAERHLRPAHLASVIPHQLSPER